VEIACCRSRPSCWRCNASFIPSQVALERDGSLDDPSYRAGLPSGARSTFTSEKKVSVDSR